MGLFDRLRERRDDAESSGANDTVDVALLRSILTGEPIDIDQAMSIPAVASSVNLIAGLISVLPIKLYKHEKRDDGTLKTTELRDDKRVFLLNVDSGDTLNQASIKRNIVRDYLVDKGGFLLIEKKKGDVSALKYIPPRQITANVRVDDPAKKDGKYNVGGGKQYEQFEIVSVLRDTEDGFLGKSLTRQIQNVLSMAVANILYEKNIVAKGGTKKGFLISENKLTKPALDELKMAWRQLYSNTSDNVIVLNKGLDFKEASDNSVDLQIDQRKKTLASELKEMFNIRSEDFDSIFKEAVLPVMEAIEAGLNKALLTEKEKTDHWFSIDKTEIVKASLKERYEAYKLASEIGVLTKNEIRDQEDLEPIEGMDVVSMGLGDVIFDVKTQTYFTPNTGETKDFNKDDANGIIDDSKSEGAKK
jgi:HK97 family phage portal protein